MSFKFDLSTREKTDRVIRQFAGDGNLAGLLDGVIGADKDWNPKPNPKESLSSRPAALIEQCIRGTDILGCQIALSNFNVNNLDVDEVRSIIEQLNFKVDGGKVEQVYSWLNRLTTDNGVSVENAKAIRENANLINFLVHVVNFANSPRGYPAFNDPNVLPNNFELSPVQKELGIQRYPMRSNCSSMRSAVDRWRAFVRLQNKQTQEGGNVNLDNINQRLNQWRTMGEDAALQFANDYLSVFETLLERLKSRGKGIKDEDITNIKNHIASLARAELALINTTNDLAKFLDLVEKGEGSNFGNKEELKTIQNFLSQKNKYFGRVERKHTTILSILEAIENALQNL